jgi:hypothetical protein
MKEKDKQTCVDRFINSSQETEKGCRWYFVPEERNHMKMGMLSGSDLLFRGKSKEISLIREVLQNSIDASDGKENPVNVTMSFGKLSKGAFPNLFDLKSHVQACMDSTTNTNDREICKPLLATLDIDTISYLKISDFNTIGLGHEGLTKLIYSNGNGKDNNNAEAQGAYGVGHNAFFGMSSIRSFLASSLTSKDNIYCFGGASCLSSHTYNNQDVSHYGYYTSKDNGDAVFERADIPALFRRDKAGTDIYILGCDKSDDMTENLVRAILNNFWLVIYRKKLVVEIEGITISAYNLKDLFANYYPKDSNDRNNPSPGYDVVRYFGEGQNPSKDYKFIQGEIDSLGKVKLYLNLSPNQNRHISYMRKPLMLISQSKLSSCPYNFSGVFICDNSEGNAILRNMESPQHDKWSVENLKGLNKEERRSYKNIVNSIDDFIRAEIEKIYVTEESEKIVLDMGNLLNPFFSAFSDKVKTNAGSEKATANGSQKSSSRQFKRKTISSITEKGNGVPQDNENGPNRSGRGNKKIEHPHTGGIPTSNGNHSSSGVDEEELGEVRKVFPVDFCAVAILKEGELYHRLYVHPDEEHQQCFLSLSIGTDMGGSDGDVNIASTSKGTVDGNCIILDNLIAGDNIIDIKISDNNKHTIIINAYEES